MTVYRSLMGNHTWLLIFMCLMVLSGTPCFGAPADSTGFLFPETARSEINLLAETFKVLLALGLTLVLLVAVLWVLRTAVRGKAVAGMDGGVIRILETRHIDPKKKIVLVRVLDRVLIIGCAEQSLTHLGELSTDDIDRLNSAPTAEPGVFKAILDRFTGAGRVGVPNGSSRNSGSDLDAGTDGGS